MSDGHGCSHATTVFFSNEVLQTLLCVLKIYLIKMATPTENVFDTLQRYDVVLSARVLLILKKLGYDSLKSVSLITVENLQKNVRSFLASPKQLSKMTFESRLDLFGEYFVDEPTEFEFLPGEQDSIRAAVDEAKTLLEKYKVNYTYEKVESRKRKIPTNNIRNKMQRKEQPVHVERPPSTEKQSSDSVNESIREIDNSNVDPSAAAVNNKECEQISENNPSSANESAESNLQTTGVTASAVSSQAAVQLLPSTIPTAQVSIIAPVSSSEAVVMPLSSATPTAQGTVTSPVAQLVVSALVTSHSPSSSCNSGSSQSVAVGEVVRKGKTLSQYLSCWLDRTDYKPLLTIEDCLVDNVACTISCKRCVGVKVFKGSADSTGCWKISTFQTHVKLYHSEVFDPSYKGNLK